MDLTLLILLIAVQSSALGSLPQRRSNPTVIHKALYVSFFHVTYQTYNFMFNYEINICMPPN